MMKVLRILFLICLYSLLFIALIAPFTFQKAIQVQPTAKEKLIELTKGLNVSEKIKIPKKPEVALHKVELPNFADIKDVKQKKQQFFDYLAPVVQQENKAIAQERLLVVSINESFKEHSDLSAELKQTQQSLVKKYRINKQLSLQKQNEELLLSVDEIPAELILVQAANESAWGTSRFARIGLNFFGIWCYTEGCGMVPNGRNYGAEHEVQAFKTINAAVIRYLNNINTNKAYRVFRTIRSQLRAQGEPLSPAVLATGLLPYSERGSDYVVELTNMIRHNKLYLQKSLQEYNAD